MSNVGIIDYKAGNLGSILNALQSLEIDHKVIQSPEAASRFSTILIPGVGSFQSGVLNLRENELFEYIISEANRGSKIVGICLGMHLLASLGRERGLNQGLNLIPGEVIELLPADGERVPHLGWSKISSQKGEDGGYMYFAHSYYFKPKTNENIKAYFEWGENQIPAIIEKENILGFQFHPEKSGNRGLSLLEKALTTNGVGQ